MDWIVKSEHETPVVVGSQSCQCYGVGARLDQRRVPPRRVAGSYFLIRGPALARTCFWVNGLSNAPWGVILSPVSNAIEAAWRASTWTIEPAAANRVESEIAGAAPL